jgi:hypothetical protein
MAEVVGGDQDGVPLPPELVEEELHQLFGADRHAVERLIQQQHRRFQGGGTGQEGQACSREEANLTCIEQDALNSGLSWRP